MTTSALTVVDVLYSVPVPGLDVRALASTRVTLGRYTFGDPSVRTTTVDDIPTIIELRRGYQPGTVKVVKVVKVASLDPTGRYEDDTADAEMNDRPAL
jgi:hypothetical protein